MVNVKFLTPEENSCLYHLKEAQRIFNDVCEEDPQSPTDSYNFGHYVDAAVDAVIIRGARRIDPENLLAKKKPTGQK